jgi:hydrophobic/amphiphilic exporter-1 (mainly G- bacteria), HAE1 family
MSVGILVTNSIVVLEAIVKRWTIRRPREASRLGAKEAFIAVLASAGTNVVVLFPLSVMPTRIGMFIGPLAMTMFIMTVVSLFISFTLTPMLCSLVLKPREDGSRSLLTRMERGWNWGFDRLVAAYRGLLQFNEHHRWAAVLTLLAVFGMFVHSMWLGGQLGTSAFAESDRGAVYLRLEFPTRYELAETIRRVQQAEARLQGSAGTAPRAQLRRQGRSDPGPVQRRRLPGPDPAEVLRADRTPDHHRRTDGTGAGQDGRVS